MRCALGLILPVETASVPTGAGWTLELFRYGDPATRAPGRRPVVMIPGYAMNSHILAYHPGGASLVEHLVAEGLEVWTANLRGQGGSRGTTARYGLAELALDDLPRVFDHVLQHTATGAERLDPVGCSLGASLMYAYLAYHPRDHRFGRAVAIGGPLRWETVHPLMRIAFASPALAGAVRFSGTRRLATLALPWLLAVPSVLSIYMNTAGVDLSSAGELLATVEDPIPRVNLQIARWQAAVDLQIRGRNVTAALANVEDLALLVVLANRDGIVTPESARSAAPALGPSRVTVMEVGTPERWYAHADMFIGRRAAEDVFTPLAAWLAA